MDAVQAHVGHTYIKTLIASLPDKAHFCIGELLIASNNGFHEEFIPGKAQMTDSITWP